MQTLDLGKIKQPALSDRLWIAKPDFAHIFGAPLGRKAL